MRQLYVYVYVYIYIYIYIYIYVYMCLDVCANDEGSLSTSFINKKNTYLKFLKIKSFNIIQLLYCIRSHYFDNKKFVT